MTNSCYQVFHYWLGRIFVVASVELEALWWIWRHRRLLPCSVVCLF